MNARDAVAIILALIVPMVLGGIVFLRITQPDWEPNERLFDILGDLINVVLGGLLTWIGLRSGGDRD